MTNDRASKSNIDKEAIGESLVISDPPPNKPSLRASVKSVVYKYAANIIGFILICAIGGFFLNSGVQYLFSNSERSKISLDQLQNEDVEFLATNKITTMVIVDESDSSLILGDRQAVMVVKVEAVWGFDLKKVKKDNIKIVEQSVIIDLPEPGLISFSVDFENARIFTVHNVSRRLYDLVKGDDIKLKMVASLKPKALDFMRSQKLIPERDVLCARVERMLRRITNSNTLTVRFGEGGGAGT
ncbi:hypothetical protein WCLP8_3020008 [uncultured Gammaproteobacteria bacterium]